MLLPRVLDVMARCDEHGAVEWGGRVLQRLLSTDVIGQLPILETRLAGHWDVLLWHAAVCVRAVHRLLADRADESPNVGVIRRAVADLAATIEASADHPLVSNPDTSGPSSVRLPWFCTIPDDEAIALRRAARERAPEWLETVARPVPVSLHP
jgi:hypothetical protein